jgi:hypothetical protein
MANPGERSINIVKENKPKVLEGLGQKGTVAGTRIFPFLVMGNNATGGQSAPTPFVVTETEHGSLISVRPISSSSRSPPGLTPRRVPRR